MKKILTSVSALLLVISICFAFAACRYNVVMTDSAEVFITIEDSLFNKLDENNQTLQAYMDLLVEKKALEYTVTNGMVETVNGVTPDASKGEYWFIYSDDTEFTNEAWGTFEYKGTKFASTTFGIEALPIKVGCTYVFKVGVYEF